jgi:hypothetical protein
MITKQSGSKQEFKSGYHRDTSEGKPRFDLMFPIGVKYEETLLYRLAQLYARGAKYYGDRNWEKSDSLEELERNKASAWRHFVQAMCGETDEDHWAAVVWNINAIVYLENKLNGSRKERKEKS